MTGSITTKTLLAAIEEVVAERGEDYVYEKPGGKYGSCVYLDNGQPSCLFGAAFTKLGVPAEVLANGDEGLWALGELLGDEGLDPNDRAAFQLAQELQDSSYDYGTVLDTLKKRLAR